jgi:hypothetical protein
MPACTPSVTRTARRAGGTTCATTSSARPPVLLPGTCSPRGPSPGMRRGQMDIVYRVGGDGFDSVLFATRASAEYVAQIRKALYQSRTWGEFRANLPEGEWENLEWKLEDPPDDEPFKADDIPGHADGDYPEWLRQSQLDWFPDDLTEKYDGEVTLTTLNGWVLDLPGNRAEEIADDLRALGHRVERTDLDIA